MWLAKEPAQNGSLVHWDPPALCNSLELRGSCRFQYAAHLVVLRIQSKHVFQRRYRLLVSLRNLQENGCQIVMRSQIVRFQADRDLVLAYGAIESAWN